MHWEKRSLLLNNTSCFNYIWGLRKNKTYIYIYTKKHKPTPLHEPFYIRTVDFLPFFFALIWGINIRYIFPEYWIYLLVQTIKLIPIYKVSNPTNPRVKEGVSRLYILMKKEKEGERERENVKISVISKTVQDSHRKLYKF